MSYHLLLESGDALLLESGSALLLESSTGYPYFERDLVAYLNGLALPAYPGHVPQSATLPAMSFLLVSEGRETMLSGSTGQVEAVYQVSVASRSAAAANVLAAQLRSKLQNYRQKLMGGTFVSTCLAGPVVAGYEPAVDGTDRGTHSRACEFTFFYREAVPQP